MIKPANAKMNLYKIEKFKKAGPKSRSKLKIIPLIQLEEMYF
jgi:hypothetical protein